MMLIYWPHCKHNPWLKLTQKQLAQVVSSELFFFNKASSELWHQFGGKEWQASRVESVFLGMKKNVTKMGGVIHDL